MQTTNAMRRDGNSPNQSCDTGASRRRNVFARQRKQPIDRVIDGLPKVGVTGLEPVTPSLSSWCSNQLS